MQRLRITMILEYYDSRMASERLKNEMKVNVIVGDYDSELWNSLNLFTQPGLHCIVG
jgi:hypothetical protein